MGEFETFNVHSMFVLLIVTGSKVFSDFVNDILIFLLFDPFNWIASARDFVTNSSTRDCFELVQFFSTHSVRLVSSTYLQMCVFDTPRSLSNDSHKNDSKSHCSAAMAISPHRISLILGRKLELLNVT